jgi:hypothetical protein
MAFLCLLFVKWIYIYINPSVYAPFTYLLLSRTLFFICQLHIYIFSWWLSLLFLLYTNTHYWFCWVSMEINLLFTCKLHSHSRIYLMMRNIDDMEIFIYSCIERIPTQILSWFRISNVMCLYKIWPDVEFGILTVSPDWISSGQIIILH